jgi:hypothetical protein
MVYPSHYPATFNGYKDPNDFPGPVVEFAMIQGMQRRTALASATGTPSLAEFRPWLQDFDYGGDYDAKDVRAQIQATYDAGIDSWIMWDPNNKYTKEAYNIE